ncbi:unnamed protein product [Pylaiella littoralis]
MGDSQRPETAPQQRNTAVESHSRTHTRRRDSRRDRCMVHLPSSKGTTTRLRTTRRGFSRRGARRNESGGHLLNCTSTCSLHRHHQRGAGTSTSLFLLR